MASIATFKGTFDVQPALNAQGQQTGMDINQMAAALALTLNVTEVVSRRFTLVNISDTTAINLGGIAQALFLIISASSVLKLSGLTFDSAGGAQIIYGQIICLIGQDATNGVSALNAVAMHPSTVVDLIAGG